MRLHLTNGKCGFTFLFAKDKDAKEIALIKASARPVTKALELIKARLMKDMGEVEGADMMKTLYPIEGQSLEGLDLQPVAQAV